VLQFNYSKSAVVQLVNDGCIIGGYMKWLWGSLHYLVLLVLQEVTVGHMAYGRLHLTEYLFPDVMLLKQCYPDNENLVNTFSIF